MAGLHRGFHDPTSMIDEALRAGELLPLLDELEDSVADERLYAFWVANVRGETYRQWRDALAERDAAARAAESVTTDDAIAASIEVANMMKGGPR